MKSIHIYLLLALLAATNLAAQNRYFVHHAATGANTGVSWTDAFTDLHDALATAVAGDEVWVAQGTYRPSETGDRSARFEMLSGVRLYGGFAATELDLSERDWQAHPTVLDGDIGTPGDSTDNSRNLLYLFRPDSFTLLDGLTFRHAVADDSTVAPGTVGNSGAALYIMAQNGEAYPAIRNCVFEHNTALRHGGAVYVNGGGTGSVAPMFDNCRFVGNRAVLGSGGALYRNGGSWVDRSEDIKNSIFDSNTANINGGSIFFADSNRSDKFDIVGTTFVNNQMTIVSLTGRVHQGSALHISPVRANGTTILSIKKSSILNNRRANRLVNNQFSDAVISADLLSLEVGNLIANFDSVYFNKNASTCFFEAQGWAKFNIENCFFYEDTARVTVFAQEEADTSKLFNTFFDISTASIGAKSSLFHIDRVRCSNNRNIEFYLNTHNSDANILANNILAYGNTHSSAYYGIGKVYSSGIVLDASVSSISTKKSTTKIINSSTYDNAIIIGTSNKNSMGFYENNSFFLTDTSYYPYKSFIPYVNEVIFHNNILNIPDTFNSPVWIKTNNQFSTDPQFVNPEAGDFRLRPCSPAINAGDNAAVVSDTDILGNPRIRYGTVDVGAVEMGELYFADDVPDVQPACPGGANGGIDVSGLEACPPVLYEWTAAPGNDTPVLAGLPAGAYALTATDANGRTVALALTVPVADPPQIVPAPTPVACGDTLGGSAAAVVSGAPGPFAFDWGPLGTDSLVTDLPPGLYPVTVTDARGCTAAGSVQVERSGNLSVTVDAQAVSCHGSADGAFTVLPANGKPPFAWNWSNPPGAAGPTAAMLGPGTYEGTLTDAFGCTIGWVLPLGQPAPLLPSAFVTDASDSSSADGSILLVPTGGTGPYTVDVVRRRHGPVAGRPAARGLLRHRDRRQRLHGGHAGHPRGRDLLGRRA
jgi:hypothetical protein